MSPRRWILLLLFYISYLMFGASIYYYIEHNLERARRAAQLEERIEINEFLINELGAKNESAQNNVLERITNYCGKPVTNYTTDRFEEPYTWTFYHAFFFSFTILSTVGYGNLAPTTTLGRMVMIAYSLIGIPINGILFSGLGDYFSRTFTSIYRRYKNYKQTNDMRYVPPQLSLLATVCIALVPGITFFIILPSLIFSYFENWSFATSVYYTYVTMTTIGFGDFVPTFQPHQSREFGALFTVYQVFTIVWFIFSLGYLVMIMTFISKGLKSKKLLMLEYQLSENIRATQHRIWNGVTKDVGYLRRILNELYIMKFKPVYNEPLHYSETRSISCPDLTMYRIDAPVIRRKRAFSECIGGKDQPFGGSSPLRTSSDTELSNINKQKTFETAESFKNTTDLLSQVVSALASVRLQEEEMTVGSSGMYGGYHGFTDSQILSGEWTISGGMDKIPHRGRAFSDFNLHPTTISQPSQNEWTWSGDNNQIQQAFNTRCKKKRQSPEEYYKSVFPNQEVVVDIDRETPDANRPRRKFSMPDGGKQFLKKLIPFRKRSSQGLIERSGFPGRKFSVNSVPEVLDQNKLERDFTDNKTEAFDANKKIPRLNIENATIREESDPFSSINRQRIFEEDTRQGAYQRNLPKQINELKKRRTSLFAQNPNMRRGSMFAPAHTSYRRGSLLTDQTYGTMNEATNRRPSLFSEENDDENKHQEILENTTIADLIRALEIMHTNAVLQPPTEEISVSKKKRKYGTAEFIPKSVFSKEQLPSNLYMRRSTIIGPASNINTATNILSRRRTSAVPKLNDPPPSYTEKEVPTFKRRFSVRPTNLHIPPGMAPPPNSTIQSNLPGTSYSTSNQNTMQTALQKRLSLRPSPLARDMNEGFSGIANRVIQSNRAGAPLSSSSTHSPLSRIVQISQAQRMNNEQSEPQ